MLIGIAENVGTYAAVEEKQEEVSFSDAPSHGVIVQGQTYLSAVEEGELVELAGVQVQLVKDDQNLSLIQSADHTDAELASELTMAGINAEPNYIRWATVLSPTETFGRAEPMPVPPTEPDFWHVASVQADLVHKAGYEGDSNIVVAVLDTGVYTHSQFTENLLPGFDFIMEDTIPEDRDGHGTHVSGIVNTLCPNCSILPVKVLDLFAGDDLTISRGIKYAASQGADVINMSLGGSAPSTVLCNSVQQAIDNGITVVASAGNGASEEIGYPAACDSRVVVVGAVDMYDNPAWFSNRGDLVDTWAPGFYVWSTLPPFNSEPDEGGRYGMSSGTSMSAPVVAGAVGLGLSHDVLPNDILTSHVDVGNQWWGNVKRIDVAEAFGLNSRPTVTNTSADVSWIPQSGGNIQITSTVTQAQRVMLSVSNLQKNFNDEVEMVEVAPGTFEASYSLGINEDFQQEYDLQVVAYNNAGSTFGEPQLVIQEGLAIPEAAFEWSVVEDQTITNTLVITPSWAGSWDHGYYECDTNYGTFLPGESVDCHVWEKAYEVTILIVFNKGFEGKSSVYEVIDLSSYRPEPGNPVETQPLTTTVTGESECEVNTPCFFEATTEVGSGSPFFYRYEWRSTGDWETYRYGSGSMSFFFPIEGEMYVQARPADIYSFENEGWSEPVKVTVSKPIIFVPDLDVEGPWPDEPKVGDLVFFSTFPFWDGKAAWEVTRPDGEFSQQTGTGYYLYVVEQPGEYQVRVKPFAGEWSEKNSFNVETEQSNSRSNPVYLPFIIR